MRSRTLDILALSETRLDNTFTDSAVSIEGYTLVRRDRCRSGGGVAMYIRNVIDYKIRSDLSDPDLEFLCIEIQNPKAKPFLLSNWYRPPNSPVELFDKFEALLGKIEAENVESNILGDINNVNSETSFINCGVTQGSILGSLLFLLYINDLPNCNLLSEVRMYADDPNLTFASKDSEELFSSLTSDLGNLKQWLDSNRLSLNVLKTKCLFTGTRRKISLLPSELHIYLDGHSIERVNSYRCLGVQVDETLSWEAHILEVVGKVAKVLAALRRLRQICPQSTLVTIYKSLILPHFDYCTAVWSSIGNGLSQKLEKLQNRAARIITGSSWDARSAPILHTLKWNSLADRRAKQLKSLMFKTVNHLVPEYLCDKFANVNTIHRHNLRGAQHNLFVPRPNTEALKKSFCYRGAVSWNSLSAEAKQATTLNNFYSAIL